MIGHRSINVVFLSSIKFQQARFTGHKLRTRSLSCQAQGYHDLVLDIDNANVYKFGDANNARPIFRKLSWKIHEGEGWAIIGTAGSDKASLIEVSWFSLYFSGVKSGGKFIDAFRPHETESNPEIWVISFLVNGITSDRCI